MDAVDVDLLSGTALSHERRVSSPRDTDVLLLSEPGLNQPDAIFYQSKHVTYGNLCKNVYADLSVGLGLGDMAFQDKDNYARSDHDHFPAYVKAEYVPNYVRDYGLSEDDDVVKVLGHIVVNGRSYDMCVPKINQSDVKVPEKPVGQLKFIAVPELQDIDENSADFDGWTYPDGRLVSKTRFPSAYAEFGPSERDTSTHFALPALSDFIELNPYVQPEDACSRKDAIVGMAQHMHQITDINIDGNVQFDLAVRCYDIAFDTKGKQINQGWKHHHGTVNDADNRQVQPTIIFSSSNIKLNTGGTTECNVIEGENYPPYNWLPVMIYIGRPVS